MSQTETRGSYVPALRFPALTRLYDPLIRATTREGAFKRRLLEQLSLERGQAVLDVGCGTGTLGLMIAERNPGVEVTGLDGDPEVLRRARAKAEAASLSVRFDEALSTELPYENGSFDRVVSTLFFHHISTPDKERTLSEVRRVLKPNGELHVADWTKPSDPVMAALFAGLRLFDGRDVTQANAEGAMPHLFREAGLGAVTEHDRLRTPFGTLAIWSVRPPRG